MSDAGQLLKMGRSKDFGKCKALRNDGQPCQMCVNKAITQYCEYHVGAAHKKLNAKRPNLQNWQGAPGNTMSVQQKKELQESSKKGLLTGPRTDSHGNKIHPGRQQIQNELDARIRSHGEDGNRRKGFGQASSFKATPTLRQSEEGRRKVMDTMSKARVGGKPSIAFAHMAQAEKLNEATRQKGVPLTQIKPSGPAPASVPKGKDAPSRISSSSGMKGVGVQKPEHNRFEVQRASECTDSLTSEPKERGSGDGANATETADGKDVFVHLNKAGGAGSAAQKVLQQIKEDQAKEDQRKAAAKKERLAAAARRDGSGVKSAASVGNSAGVNRPQSAAGKGHQANTVLRWEENAKNKDKRKREDDTLKSWVHKEKAKTHDAQDDTKKRRVERGPEVGGISARGASAQGMKGAELSSKPLPKIPHKGEKPEPKPWGKGGFGGEAGTTLRLHVCTNECEDEAGHSLQTTHLCVLCRVVLCSACSNQHRTAKLTRDHNLIDLKQAAKQRAHEEGGMEPIRNAGVPSAATATAVVHSGASLRNGDDTTVEANSTKVSEADVAHALGPAAVAAARNADDEEADDEDELSLIATDSSGQQFFRTEQDVASEAAFESPRQKMDDDEAEDEIVFEETDRPALAPEEGKHQGDDDSAIGDEEGMSDFSARKRLRQVGSSDDECSGKEGASDAEEDGVHGRAVEVSCLETETDLRAQQAIRRAQSVIDNRPFYENKDKRRKVIVSESEGEPGSGSESESIGQVEAAEAGGEDSNGPWTAKIHHKILQHGHSTAKDSGDSSSCFRGSCSVREGGAREEAKVEDADQGESQLIIDDKKVAAVDDSEKERDFSSPGRFHRQLQSRAARAAQEPELKPLPLPSAACAATASDREGSIGTGALSLPCTKPTPVTTKKRTMVVTEEGADKNFAEQVVSESAMIDRKMAAQQLAQAGVKLGSSGNQEGMTREDAAARERANEARKRELEDDKARKDAARRRCLKIAPGADTLGEEGAGVGGCSDDDDDGTLELGWVATVDAVKGVKSVVASGPRKSGLSGKFAHVAAKLNTEEGRRTLESGSRHASLAKEEVEARKEQKMDKLHEQCQLAMMSEATFEEQCSIFTCDECVPTVRDWRPPPCCKTASKGGKGHSCSKTSGKKYWFECGSCKTRDAAIALVGPNFDCFRCGARDWRRVSTLSQRPSFVCSLSLFLRPAVTFIFLCLSMQRVSMATHLYAPTTCRHVKIKTESLLSSRRNHGAKRLVQPTILRCACGHDWSDGNTIIWGRKTQRTIDAWQSLFPPSLRLHTCVAELFVPVSLFVLV